MESSISVILNGKTDPYHGITINSSDYEKLVKIWQLEEVVRKSVVVWLERRLRGIWIRVDIKNSEWVPVLAHHGFQFHHAQTDFVMMTRWLPPGEKSMLPRYPFTSIGVGGITVNREGKFLLMKERRGHYLGYKFPGGMADHKEQIAETAVRETFEETGVETVSEGILCFRHSHRTPYPQCSDIYFLVVLKPKDENNITPTPCPSEAAAADWLTIKQIQNLGTKEKHPFIDNMIVQYQKWKKRKGSGIYDVKVEAAYNVREAMMYFCE